jgi:sec-independent protein translocase protein TatB
MFDVSFSELALILIVGLLVFGPEKLPEVIRTVGLWIAKIKRTYTQVRTEIEREMGVDELKRDLHNSALMQNLKDVQHDLQRTQQELQHLPYEVNDVVQRAHNNASSSTTQATSDHSVAHSPAADDPVKPQ